MRKEELRHDPVRERIVKGVHFIKDNQNTVLKIFVGLIILVSALSYYNHTGSLKIENSSNIAGLAQNTFINGGIDAALVKFERVINDYPGTYGAAQSLVYLLNDAVGKEDYEAIADLISQFKGGIDSIDDPVVRATIYKIQGDKSLYEGRNEEALLYYRKAESGTKDTSKKINYKLDIVSILLLQQNYIKAKHMLEDILDSEDVGFNEKNRTEEFLGYAHHKLGT